MKKKADESRFQREVIPNKRGGGGVVYVENARRCHLSRCR